VSTARYAQSPYITQIRFVFKRLKQKVTLLFSGRLLRLIHTCHAAPLPFSASAASFVKVRVVARNIRTASPTV
jgi:ribosomal protein L28